MYLHFHLWQKRFCQYWYCESHRFFSFYFALQIERREKKKKMIKKKTLTTEEWILCSNLIFLKFLIRKCISLVSNFYLFFPLYSFSHIRLPVYSKHLIKKLFKLIASAVNIFWKMNVTFAMFFRLALILKI